MGRGIGGGIEAEITGTDVMTDGMIGGEIGVTMFGEGAPHLVIAIGAGETATTLAIGTAGVEARAESSVDGKDIAASKAAIFRMLLTAHRGRGVFHCQFPYLMIMFRFVPQEG